MPSRLERLLHHRVHYDAVVQHAAAGDDLVGEVRMQRAVADEVQQQVADVTGQQHARVLRHGAPRVPPPDEGHTVAYDVRAGHGQLEVAPAVGGEVDDHRAGA